MITGILAMKKEKKGSQILMLALMGFSNSSYRKMMAQL